MKEAVNSGVVLHLQHDDVPPCRWKDFQRELSDSAEHPAGNPDEKQARTKFSGRGPGCRGRSQMCELNQGGSGTPIRLFTYDMEIVAFWAIIITIWFTAQSARPLSPQSLSGDGLSAISLSALLKQTGGRFTFTSHPWFCRGWLTFKDKHLIISADERENDFQN